MAAHRILQIRSIVGYLKHDIAELGGLKGGLQRGEQCRVGLTGNRFDPGLLVATGGSAHRGPGMIVIARINWHTEHELGVNQPTAQRLTVGAGRRRLLYTVDDGVKYVDDD